MADDGIYYRRGALSEEQLRSEIGQFWEALSADPVLRSEVSQAQIDLKQLDHIDHAEAITVRPKTSGADPNVLLLLALAPTANRMLKDLWKTILLPRIRRRWGDDAVGPEVEQSDR